MNAVDYIKHWEGFVPRLYLCPAGYPTIGYGTRVATWSLRLNHEFRSMFSNDKGNWLTEEQATALMLPAVERAQRAVLAAGLTPYDDELDSPRGIALTDIAYNMGGFSKFPRFVAAVKTGDWAKAHDELLWIVPPTSPVEAPKPTAYYRQTGRRAECNAQVILTGVMPEVLP